MHVPETELALFATGDLARWPQLKVSIHVRRCGRCRTLVDAYRADAEFLKAGSGDLPEGVAWDRLSAEMSANIHLGLAAGEIVAQPKRREAVNMWEGMREGFWGWQAAAAGLGVVLLIGSAWWLNMPPSTNQSLRAVAERLFSRGPFGPVEADFGPVVVASPEKGIALHENGGSLVNQTAPLTVTVSNTEASTQYFDEDTEQLVITTVYVE